MSTELKAVRRPSMTRWVLFISLLSALGLLAVAGFGKVRYGSMPAAVAAMRGESLFVAEPMMSLGEMVSDRPYKVNFEILNNSAIPVSIIGSKSSCSCAVAIDSFPVTIPARGKRQLTVITTLRDQEPLLSQTVSLRLDLPTQPEVVVGVTGRRAQKTN
jgi:hypothetical protein